MAVVVVAVVGILALVVAVVVRRSAHPDGPEEAAHSSDIGTHLEPHGDDLKAGHNRAVNACNVLSADLLSQTLGPPRPDRAPVTEKFADENVAPTLLPDTSAPFDLSSCERSYGQRARSGKVSLNVMAYANEELARQAWDSIRGSERDSLSWHDYRELDDTLVSSTQGDNDTPVQVHYASRFSSYTIVLDVSSTWDSRMGEAESDLARSRTRADGLARQVRERLGDTAMSTRPGQLRAKNSKTADDACELVTGTEFHDQLLDGVAGLNRYGRTLWPIAERGWNGSGGESTCHRWGGARHFSWADGPEPSRPPASGQAGAGSETLDMNIRAKRFSSAAKAEEWAAYDRLMDKQGAKRSKKTVTEVRGVGKSAHLTVDASSGSPYTQVETVVGDQVLTLKVAGLFRPEDSTWHAPERSAMIAAAKLAVSRMS